MSPWHSAWRSLRPRSIRGRLLFLLLVMAVVPLLLAGWIAGHWGRSFLEESTGSSLSMVAEAVINSLDQRITNRRDLVQALTKFPVLQQAAAGGAAVLPGARRAGAGAADAAWSALPWRENPVVGHPASVVLRDLQDDAADLIEIFFTDREGWVVGATNKTEDFYQADEKWWQKAAARECGTSYVGSLEYDPSAGDYVTAISVPICRDHTVVGVLKAGLTLRHTLDLVPALAGHGAARVWIIKANGEIVASLDREWRILEGVEGRVSPVAEVARRIRGAPTGFLQGLVSEVPSLVGYASSSGRGLFHGLSWRALVVEPVSVAFRPVAAFQRTIGMLLLVMLGAVLLLGIRASLGLTRPIRHSSQMARAIAEGHLTRQAPFTGRQELDHLAAGLNGMSASLRRMVGGIRRAAGQVESATRTVAGGAGCVVAGSRDQIQEIRRTVQLMQEADTALVSVSASVQEMAAATDKSSSSLREVDTNIGRIAESTEVLSATTEASGAAIRGMVESVKRVDGGVEELHSLAEGTAGAVAEMNRAIQAVERIALDTAQATGQAADDAETGRAAVERTVAGMQEIEAAAARTGGVIRGLTEDVGRIGTVLDIIKGVTDRVNLLALNASIIATQAGEHGRGFQVVAYEIKDLAQRTARSTGEITTLVRSIEGGATEVREAMEAGSHHIVDGVALSREAQRALQKIQDGTRRSSERVQEIASATSEHAAQTRQITAAMNRLHETVTAISQTTQSQSAGCASLLAACEQVQQMTVQVQAAMSDQKLESAGMTESVAVIVRMAREIQEAAGKQKSLSRGVMQAMDRIEAASTGNVASLSDVDSAVQALARRAVDLREQIAFFRDTD
ncbi:MAG: methyl-accepting chemotaxis protein [Acidobacteriota bacterium]